MKVRLVFAFTSFIVITVTVGIVLMSRPRSNVELDLPEQTASLPGPDTVPNNRGSAVATGFRGDVHPLLVGETQLELTAYWSPIGEGREKLRQQVPEDIYRLFRDLAVAEKSRVYTAKDFSGFLPQKFERVGQMWEINPDDVAQFLTQFHPNPRMHAVSRGRRAGPDGAFAVLRAVSSTHIDIVFRAHAEFQLGLNMWYTPAYFSGRMLVNRQSGTVEYFQTGIPADRTLNVHMTVMAAINGGVPDVNREIQHGDEVVTARDIVRVEQMELTSGAQPDSVEWTEQMPVVLAQNELKKVFYKFMEINWVPFQDALAEARRTNRPILAAVSWGGLDDQSC